AFLQFPQQCSSLAVDYVPNSPTAGAFANDESNCFCLPEVLESDIYQRAPCFIPRRMNCELLNFHVLRVKQRIAIDRADFVLRSYRISPNQISQALLEIFVKQRATSRLKERTVFVVVLRIEIADQRIWRHAIGRGLLGASRDR